MKIAVTGKGGSGKTTIAGTLARIYAKKGFKVLAIDADDNPNLALTIGIPYEKLEVLGRPIPTRLLAYEGSKVRLLMKPEKIVERYSMEGPDGVKLLIMAKIERAGVGCACGAHATVREFVNHLIPRVNEVIIMDMEPGLEIFGRATPKYTDVILAVAEPYYKSIMTAIKIAELAKDLGVEKVYGVINKVRSAEEKSLVAKAMERNGVKPLAAIPYDEAVYKADMAGKALIDFKPDSPAVKAIEDLSNKLLLA